MEQMQTLIDKYQLIGRAIIVNTLDGKTITGKLLKEESYGLIFEDWNGIFLVAQSAIASIFIYKDSLNSQVSGYLGIKSLPQTPLGKQ